MAGNADIIWGAVIAGGTARRMGGGYKFLKPLAGRNILAHVVDRARPQVAGLLLNINALATDSPELRGFGLPVVGDGVPDGGPLAGILAAFGWLDTHQPAATHLATFAADTPFFPRDLVARLRSAADDLPASAASGGRRHPIFTLWPRRTADALRSLWQEEDVRSVNAALDHLGAVTADFSVSPSDPFFNINTPEDLVTAEALAASPAPENGG